MQTPPPCREFSSRTGCVAVRSQMSRLRSCPQNLGFGCCAHRRARQHRRMEITAQVRERGGVMRVQTLRRIGASATGIRRAKHAGRLVTLRRGWVGVPDADPLVSSAVREGVMLACITAAAHHGLWVPDTSEVHVAAPAHAGHVATIKGVVHWSLPLFPRDPDLCIDGVENALIQIATCRPFEEAVVVWESALRKRRRRRCVPSALAGGRARRKRHRRHRRRGSRACALTRRCRSQRAAPRLDRCAAGCADSAVDRYSYGARQ